MNAFTLAALVGVVMALAVGVAATAVGLDRDRALYPVSLIVIASFYALFAAIDGSASVILAELPFIAAFAATALLGFKRNLWLVAAGLFLHGVYDLLHPHIVLNAGVPSWWPMFCLTYDVTAALYLAFLLIRAKGGPVRPGSA